MGTTSLADVLSYDIPSKFYFIQTAVSTKTNSELHIFAAAVNLAIPLPPKTNGENSRDRPQNRLDGNR